MTKRFWNHTAGLLAAITLTACVADPTQATTEQAESAGTKAIKEGSEWIGVYTNYATAVSMALSLFIDPPEDEVQKALRGLYSTLISVEVEIGDLGGLIISSNIANEVSDLATESRSARRDLETYGYVPAANASTYLNVSALAIQRLVNNDHYWSHLFVDAATTGEWKAITAFRPPVTAGTVWDYRWALPALIIAIPMRINTLLAADPVSLKAGVYNAELEGYRNKLLEAMTTIESHIACNVQIGGEAFAAMWGAPPRGTFHVHAICGDPFTGQEVVYTQDVADLAPEEIPFFGGSSVLFDIYDADADRPCCTVFNVGALRARFWDQLSSDAALQNWIDQSLSLARSQLRSQLGLFEVRRAIDNLYTVIHRDPGPVTGGRVRSAFSGICLSHRLALYGGANEVVTAGCDSPLTHTFGQTWTYDPVHGSFRSDSDDCLAILGEPYRAMSMVVTTACDASSEAQQWSYDPESHLIRNAQTMVLDIYNGTTTPGASVWSYWEWGGAAQQWGFPSAWTVRRGGGGIDGR